MKENNEKQKYKYTNKIATKKLLAILWKLYSKQLIIVAFCVTISTLVNVIMSVFLRKLIDNYVIPMSKLTNPDYTALYAFITKVGIIFLIGVLASFLYSRIMVYVAEGTINHIRLAMFKHMESLPISYFDTHSHGSIMSFYTNDIQTMNQMISNTLPAAISSAMTITFVIVTMLIQSIPLTMVVILTVGLMFLVLKKVGSKSSGHFMQQQGILAEQNGFDEEMIAGMKVVKVFNHEDKAIEDFREINTRLISHTSKANFLSLSLMPTLMSIGNLQYALLATVGGYLSITKIIPVSVGIIAAFLQLSKSLSGPMNQVAQQINQVVLALAGARRIFEFMDEIPDTDSGTVELVNAQVDENGKINKCENRCKLWAWYDKENTENPYTLLKGDIRFKDVDFSYDGKKYVLENISLFAKPGQKLAFVGPTGAGKTTITNLINRFYELDSGVITYDGIDISRIKKDDLRKSLGMVLQDTNLFTGTIKYNLKFGAPHATDEEIIEGAKRAKAHEFIMNLKDGYDTVISGTESDLSSGQSQLLSIARAEISDPPVMILDEATSSIDSYTEKIVQEGMDEIMKGRTTFVIAHRLSTIMNSDAIIVLQNGKIVERGDHEELLKQGGIYSSLYNSGFEEEN